jgi:hypothetical protein
MNRNHIIAGASALALLASAPVDASYLIEPTITAGLSRSQVQCGALGCDGGWADGKIKGTEFSVKSASGGPILANDPLYPPDYPLETEGLLPNTEIVTQLSGTTGGAGTYQVNQKQEKNNTKGPFPYGQTIYWWEVIALEGGESAIVIDDTPGSPFGSTTTVNGVTAGLTPEEQAELVTVLPTGMSSIEEPPEPGSSLARVGTTLVCRLETNEIVRWPHRLRQTVKAIKANEPMTWQSFDSRLQQTVTCQQEPEGKK